MDKENSIECRAKETKWPAYRETLGGQYRGVSTTDNERALGEFSSGRFIGLSFVSGPLLSTHISLFIIIHAGRSRCIVNVTRDHARLCVLYVCSSSSSNTKSRIIQMKVNCKSNAFATKETVGEAPRSFPILVTLILLRIC